jgi:hypothetical protein
MTRRPDVPGKLDLCPKCRDKLESFLDHWLDAYPTDLFAEIREGEIDVSRSRVAASMARHVLSLTRMELTVDSKAGPEGGE